MNALLIVQDPLIRDTIAIGLECVPGATVEAASDAAAIERARRRKFDVVFVGHDPRDRENGNGLEIVAKLREFEKTAEAILVTDARIAKTLGAERERLNLAAFLRTPIDPNEFFRLAVRLRARTSAAKAKVERNAH